MADQAPLNFLEKIIEEDLKSKKIKSIVTRFPPEPNGYLHIGHIKSICLNFLLAQKYNGICHLRLDDTNPEKEEDEYIQAIKKDIKWLGFDWKDKEFYASDYYDQLYEIAIDLIKKNLAYVDHLSSEEVKEYRGTLTQEGKPSPYRDRSIEENLRLFNEMKEGKHKEGSCFLRAKLDMSSPNINLRDPALYRIKFSYHPRTKNKWCIYPMYDFTHPISDAIEGITHSICTLEFEDHRPAYDWATSIDNIEHRPHQYEFARLNITYFVMSKRRLLDLVKNNYVDGWDDPRMPTISGIRRRGYTAAAMRDFMERIGVAKVEGIVEYSLLEFCVREDLNKIATRVMAVLDPIKLVITNYPDGKKEEIVTKNNPSDESAGTHISYFTKNLWIEREDFSLDPPKKYNRLFIGNEVRLIGAYYVTPYKVDVDKDGNVICVYANYADDSFGGLSEDKRKVRGSIHWVSDDNYILADIHSYDKLFKQEIPGKRTGNYLDDLNPDSLKIIKDVKIEKYISECKEDEHFQFMRNGYYFLDYKNTTDNKKVYNLSISLKDGFNKK